MKTETKHTPGPWRVAKHDALRFTFHIDAGPAGYERNRVAIVSGDSARDCAEANARLIAAAPELLEALEGLVDDYRKLFAAYQEKAGERAFGWGLLPAEMADKAIAKARGTEGGSK